MPDKTLLKKKAPSVKKKGEAQIGIRDFKEHAAKVDRKTIAKMDKVAKHPKGKKGTVAPRAKFKPGGPIKGPK